MSGGWRTIGHGLATSALAVALGVSWAADAGQGAASPDAGPSAGTTDTAATPARDAPVAPGAAAAPVDTAIARETSRVAPTSPARSAVRAPDDAVGGESPGTSVPTDASAPSAPSETAATDAAGARTEAETASPASRSTTAVDPPAAASVAPASQTVQPRPEPPRPSLLPLAQPLWSDLGDAQRQVLEPFASQWNALPSSEKRAWSDLARRFPRMKPEVQKRVQQRIVQWAALTPEQRRVARENYRLAQQVPRQSVAAEWESYQTMTPEQRSVLVSAGSTPSNTAARSAAGPTGLARVAFQPLPRRAKPVITEAGSSAAPVAGSSPAGDAAAAPRR